MFIMKCLSKTKPIIILFFLFLISCTKQNEVLKGHEDVKVGAKYRQSILKSDYSYIHNGISAKFGYLIPETDSISIVDFRERDGNVYVFDNDSLLRLWAHSDTGRFFICKYLDTISTILGSIQNMDLLDDSLFIESCIRNYFPDNPEGPASLAFLHRDANQQGTMWHVTSPNYRRNRNMASSFTIMMTNCVICDHTWWGGAKIFLFGWPGHKGNLDVEPYFFDDRAESGLGL